MLSRELRTLKEGKVADVATAVAYADSRLAELEHFRSETGDRMLAVMANYDSEKVALVINELQRLKSQIYYIQQSVIQIKTQGSGGGGNEGGDDATAIGNNTSVESESTGSRDDSLRELYLTANGIMLLTAIYPYRLQSTQSWWKLWSYFVDV
jgi:hypothetical protein